MIKPINLQTFRTDWGTAIGASYFAGFKRNWLLHWVILSATIEGAEAEVPFVLGKCSGNQQVGNPSLTPLISGCFIPSTSPSLHFWESINFETPVLIESPETLGVNVGAVSSNATTIVSPFAVQDLKTFVAFGYSYE